MRQTLLLLVFVPLMSWSQENDSTAVADVQGDDRNVMLDASASAKPRDIPIGLPGETGGTMIMEDGMRAKFSQNPDAAKMLKATGDAILIKSCKVCYKCGFGEGSGFNRMGKILMQIRDEIK